MGNSCFHTHGHRKEVPDALESDLAYGPKTQFIADYLRER